jgi:hypothetical protein
LPREETLWLLGPEGLCEFEELKSSDPDTRSIALRESGFYSWREAAIWTNNWRSTPEFMDRDTDMLMP